MDTGEGIQGGSRDLRGIERRLGLAERTANRSASEDVVIDGDRRLILRAPNGTYYAVSVDNAGALYATATIGPA